MRPYHPTDGGADPGSEPTPEQATKGGTELSRRIDELMASLPQGRECPKCGCSMTHYRLYGYRCIRGCQP